MHESRQIGMLNVLNGWLPNDLTAECKLLGHRVSPLLLAFWILPLVEKICSKPGTAKGAISSTYF
jgi:hypothetical protein